MKPADVHPSVYIEYCLKDNDKNLKLKVGGHMKISKYKNIFARS